MALSPQWLDELRSRVTLSGVIGRTVKVQKAGREFKACCPFHNEKTPSFTINDEKGFYHCFGCGAHGDVIRWMTDNRGLPFMDAVKELAQQAGMEVPAMDPREAKRAEQRASLNDVMAAAQAWFVDCLKGPQGSGARAYLAKRGFKPETLARFGFGFAPEDRQALKNALAELPEAMLEEAGLRIRVDGKEPYDRFRGRLMLPIQDLRGRVIGFGGRILDNGHSDAPKYLNSPDTPLFDKGRTLYNLNRAGPEARQSGRLVVVEGYMDVIALAEAGVPEAVAPMGTALTEAQLELLWRFVETPVLCFDGDAAGQRAATRAITRALPMLKPAHSLRILTLPAGLDPDDLVRQQGAAAFLALLDHAVPLVEAIWTIEQGAGPLTTPEDKAGLKARLLAHVETIQHPDIRSLYKRELLERFSAWAFPPREAQFNPGERYRKRAVQPPRPATRPLAHDAAQELLLAATLAGLTLFPSALPSAATYLTRLHPQDRALAALTDLLLELAESGQTLDSAALATILRQRGVADITNGTGKDRLAGLRLAFLDPGSDPVAAGMALGEALSLLVERPAIRVALAQATERFAADPEGSMREQERLRKRMVEFDRRLLQMAAARGQGDGLLGGNPDRLGEQNGHDGFGKHH